MLFRSHFDYSNAHQGRTTRNVADWQIDLGNYCNGGCVYCSPDASSTLATEFKQLGLIDQLPTNSWCDDPVLLEKFIVDLNSNTDVKYLHFIGGETLITPGFKTILNAVVNTGQSKNITVGFTTNLTVWKSDIIELLEKFEQVHVGLSIETLTPVNDYVRYPSRGAQTKTLLDRWVSIGQERGWLIQLRNTVSCLTVAELPSLYNYAWDNNVSVESCNFLYRPDFMRVNVLPKKYRKQIQQKFQQWLDQHPMEVNEQVVNTRDPNLARLQIYQDAKSYIRYLDEYPEEPELLPKLVEFLKKLESNRGNCILDYLPDYEELFRSAGY